ncbi:MAG: DUF3515 domain-containing protein [Actinomycetota bacterium]|nr:DUF3515 domain-containing protein [Actinomycetota bacterium]
MALPVAVAAGLITARVATLPAVHVDGAPFTIEGRRVCPRLVDGLPNRLGKLAARRVEGGSGSAAAWGGPPVVLRCGVAPRIAPVGQIVVLDGVEWTTDVDKTGVTWTTVGRRVNVAVRVPGRYDSQGPLLSTLSPAIKDMIPKA